MEEDSLTDGTTISDPYPSSMRSPTSDAEANLMGASANESTVVVPTNSSLTAIKTEASRFGTNQADAMDDEEVRSKG